MTHRQTVHAQWSTRGPQSCAVQGYASFSRRQRGLEKTMQSKPTRAAALRLWDRPKGAPRHRARLHKRLKQASPRGECCPSTAANSTAIQPASSPTPPQARGAGFAKNTAVASSSGEWLCFLDADDTMHADRIERQYALAKEHESIRRKAILAAPTTDATAASGTALTTATPPTTGHVLVGAGFVRKPAGSTEHYTRWCNSLTPAQLWLQQFREVTLYSLHGSSPDSVRSCRWVPSSAQPRTRKPIPSDLIFFHRHIDLGGTIARVEAPLIMYRYVGKSSVSWNIPRKDLLRVRLRALERRVLRPWIQRRKAAAANSGERSGCFTLWGAGRDGKTVLNELGDEFVRHVRAFCDVDPKNHRGYHNRRVSSCRGAVHRGGAACHRVRRHGAHRRASREEHSEHGLGRGGRLLALDLKRVLSPSPCLPSVSVCVHHVCVHVNVSIRRKKKKS